MLASVDVPNQDVVFNENNKVYDFKISLPIREVFCMSSIPRLLSCFNISEVRYISHIWHIIIIYFFLSGI